MGVTGGTPLGFDVGAQGAGGTLKGLDLVKVTLAYLPRPYAGCRALPQDPNCAALM